MSLLHLILAVCLLCLLLFFLHSRSVRGLLSASSERTHAPANVARPRISRDPALIQADYDIVVIGSGYGGGVAASRLARAGKKVCVLERGAEMLNGQFPQSFKSALRETNIKDMRPGRYGSLGKASGLYQINKGKGQDVFTGSGLGGTSLINAGVFLRANKRVFEDPMWPTEIRTDADSLEQYYERGERMLRPSPYPETLPKPQKLSVFEQLANHLGIHHRLYRPPLTISFEDGTNGAGVAMSQSTGSGNECTGLNDGSKNSVYTTYLADAWTWGAEMFCGVDVSHLSKAEGENGYLVYYRLRNRQDRNRVMWVRAKEVVVLGAGALGTTEILLRSRSHGLSVSPLIGTRMSGNGDLLAFAYNCNQEVNAVGGEAHTISHTARCGPTITACIDMRGDAEAENVRNGFMIQEGAIPGALGPVIQAMIEARIPATRLYNSVEEVIARFKSWVLGPYAAQGSVNRTAVYLVMSHDENEGTLSIPGGKLDLRWSGVGAKSVDEGIKNLLGRATASMNGTFVAAPSITVHPLGGACMSHDNTGLGGAVNHMGQLYSGPESNIHEGIICVDAATIPTSLGVNPCATINALAERCCDLLIHQRGWNADERPNEQLNFAQAPYRSHALPVNMAQRQKELRLCDQHGGLMFDETLHGYLHVTNDDYGFESAFERAKMVSSCAKASMTVSLYRTASRSYRGCVTGSLSFSALSKDPLLITKGCVEFFTIDEDVSDAVSLIYTLELLDTDSSEYVLHGHKTIDSRVTLAPFRAWVATTTLFTTISRKDGTRVAKGILKLSPSGFLSEMLSLRCNPASSYAEHTFVKARFLSFFGRNLISYLLSPLRPLHHSGSMKPLAKDYEKARPTEARVQAIDGIRFSIQIWQPSRAVPSKETPIMLIPGASVDHQMFSLPTVPVNTIDYFTSQGYRCYVPVLRFGINTEARNGWTVFDARLDVKAALEFIRAQENNSKIYAIVHCLGSIAAATALLQGDIEASWLCGMTCSQVFTDLIYSKDNDFKAQHQSLTKMYKALVGNWFSCRSSASASPIHYLLDQLLRFYPIGSRKEFCNSAVCHRCDLPFGRCWSHANLNHATHARLDEIFDGIHMNFLTHLSRMGASPPHHIRSNFPDFANLVTPQNMQRLVGLRICFLSGADNAVWEPNATKKSFDTFRQTFPGGRYDRVVIQGYGHLDCWMGKNAFIDVYPRVRRHIDFCSQSS